MNHIQVVVIASFTPEAYVYGWHARLYIQMFISHPGYLEATKLLMYSKQQVAVCICFWPVGQSVPSSVSMSAQLFLNHLTEFYETV